MNRQKCQTCGKMIKDKVKIKAYGSVFCSQACLDKWNEIVLDQDRRFHS